MEILFHSYRVTLFNNKMIIPRIKKIAKISFIFYDMGNR